MGWVSWVLERLDAECLQRGGIGLMVNATSQATVRPGCTIWGIGSRGVHRVNVSGFWILRQNIEFQEINTQAFKFNMRKTGIIRHI